MLSIIIIIYIILFIIIYKILILLFLKNKKKNNKKDINFYKKQYEDLIKEENEILKLKNDNLEIINEEIIYENKYKNLIREEKKKNNSIYIILVIIIIFSFLGFIFRKEIYSLLFEKEECIKARKELNREKNILKISGFYDEKTFDIAEEYVQNIYCK